MTFKSWFCLYLLLTFLLSGCERSLTFEEYVKKAENYSARGDNEKAIDAYKKALQLRPGDSNTHYALACSYGHEWRAAARQGAWNSAELKTYNARLKELTGR